MDIEISNWGKVPVSFFKQKGHSLSEMKERFTYRKETFLEHEPPQEIQAYRVKGDQIWLPRMVIERMFKDSKHSINYNVKEDGSIGVDFTANLYESEPPQKRLFNDFFKKLVGENRSGAIFSAPPGTGKTVIGCKLISEVDLRTIIFVDKEFLMDQWKEELLDKTTLREEDIGRIQGTTIDWEKPVVMGTLQTLSLKDIDDFPREIFGSFGLNIIDEVHVAGAKKLHRAVARFAPKFRCGFSATPKRGDGFDGVISGHIGFVQTERKKYDLKAKVFRVILPNLRVYDMLSQNYGRMITQLSESYKRNLIITKYIKNALDQGKRILVLTSRIDHIDTLQEQIQQEIEDDEEVKIGKAVGGMSNDEIDREADVLFGTSKFIKKGFDHPRLDCIFLTIPYSDVEQMVGRILREHSEKSTPVVMDFIDRFDMASSIAQKRLSYYKDKDFEIQRVRV